MVPPFVNPEPPFEPDDPTPPPTLTVPQPPPEVGEGSPWEPADGENRDRILDWWRMWWRVVFFPWVAAWTLYWDTQWQRLAAYINTWIAAADQYISDHAISGNSWRSTPTEIATVGTTDVVVNPVDGEFRPLAIGDLVASEGSGHYGRITVLIDATHATVAYVSTLPDGPIGPQGIPGVVQSIVPGANITVDNTDPANPVVASTGGSGGSALYGLYADRPAVGTVSDLSLYYCSDIPDVYMAVSGVWTLVDGSGTELGYAQTNDPTLFSVHDATPVIIPGLVVNFVPGAAPVMVNFVARVGITTTAGIHPLLHVFLDGVEIAQFDNTMNQLLVWQTVAASCRLYGLVPGEIHQVDLRLSKQGGDPSGDAICAADVLNPLYLQTVSL